MPTFRIEDEQGQWLTDMRLSTGVWTRGHDTLEVVSVRPGDMVTLVVRGHGRNSD